MTDMYSLPLGSDMPQVLVVDDDPDINRLLQVRLRNVGFSVRSAADGESAIEEMQRQIPDVVLLDISMPGMSGLEVLDRIRKDQLDVAVVMTTAFGSESIAVDALRRGADDYLRKPFEPDEFRAVIDRIMSRLHLRRQNEHLRKQLDAELLRASQIQRELLPKNDPDVPGYDIAMCAVATEVVGGEFYDWTLVDGGSLAFTHGDVMGKGLSAALLMATVRASLRSAIKAHGPANAVNTISDVLHEDLKRTRSSVSMFVGYLQPRSHVIEYVDAGHGLALLVRADDGFEHVQGIDVPVGIFPDNRYQAHQISLSPGDALLLYSDGLRDAVADGDFESLVSIMRESPTSHEAIEALAGLAAETRHRADEVTVVMIRREQTNGSVKE